MIRKVGLLVLSTAFAMAMYGCGSDDPVSPSPIVTQPSTGLVWGGEKGVQKSTNYGAMFKTKLLGDEEVPPVDTPGHGVALFKVSKDGMSLDYKLVVNGLVNVRFSHIHGALAGQNGGVIATLYPGPTTDGMTNGMLAKGTLTAADLSGMQILDLVEKMRNGMTYVNVHTDDHPSGAIRGQIYELGGNH